MPVDKAAREEKMSRKKIMCTIPINDMQNKSTNEVKLNTTGVKLNHRL